MPRLSQPFPAIVPVKPHGTAELNAANPIVFGHAFSNETPHMDTWQVSYERQITNTLMAEVAYAGSKGSNLIWVGNINEVQPGPGSQASRRLIQPLSNVANILYFDTNNSSSYNGLQVKLNQRFSHGLQYLVSYTFAKSLDYAGSPASGGGAVGGPQSVTLFDESRGPSGFDVKHRFVLSWVWDLPFGKDHAMASGRVPEADPRELAVRRHRDALDRPPVHGLPEHRRQQRRAVVAGPHRRRHGSTTPSVGPLVRPDGFKAPEPNHYGTSGRGILYAPGTQTVDVSLSRVFPVKRRFACSSGPTRSTSSTRPSSASRTRTSARRPWAGSRATIADNRSMQFALKLDF